MINVHVSSRPHLNLLWKPLPPHVQLTLPQHSPSCFAIICVHVGLPHKAAGCMMEGTTAFCLAPYAGPCTGIGPEQGRHRCWISYQGFRSLLRFLYFFNFSRLQELVDRVLERFQASGLIVKEWNSVKLHATVMNTLFRKDPNGKSCVEMQHSVCLARPNGLIPGVWIEWAVKDFLLCLLFLIC